MKVEDSNISGHIQDIFISDFGMFYFFNGFIISEVNEGVTFNWDASKEVIQAAIKHYGEKPNVCYISNRINEYSVSPLGWPVFFKKHTLNGYAIVTYTRASLLTAMLEKVFISVEMERFIDLYDAINWAKKINSKKAI